jgi:replicative DNA helicase
MNLHSKKSFRPDIIFIDYLNICSSSRFRGGSNVNSYTLVKSIAEELRGLAVEFNVPILVLHRQLVVVMVLLMWN